ncbi:MAG: hypothetical protein ACI9FN_001424 [Saprospiraceae bacterium]|jgi:hypothetical protein
MKLYSKILLAIAFLFLAQSCEDIIGGDINRDPNNPTSVPVTAQTANIQIALADNYGGNFSRFNCMLSQQVEGVARQWSSFNQYTGLTPNRFDNAWNGVYENVLNELRIARASTTENGFNHYAAVVDILEAFTLMMATDNWDNMPYSEAVKGFENINPAFDTQASIYDALNTFLDGAISKLNGPQGGIAPGNEDVYYKGDMTKWMAAAHAIKARGLLHFGQYAAAAAEAKQAFTSSDQNMGFVYPDANQGAPWYRFNDGRTGDIEFHPTMRQIMTDLNDTDRLAVADVVFITDNVTPFIGANIIQELITYREMQFIIAEADARTGGTQEGYDAYLSGIKASFERYGLGDAEYDAYVAQAEVAPGVGNLTLEQVMTQKYIGLYLQPEVYNDYRRTNIPNLSPVSGSNVPVRWPIAQTEELFNANAPAPGSIDIYNDKVGWNR